jgi:hypothetical protein
MSVDVSIPRTVLPTLDGNNYHSWAIEVQTFFEAKDLWDIVTGDIPVAVTITNDDGTVHTATTADAAIRRNNATIQSILLSSVDKSQRSHIINIGTATGMWAKLRQIHNAPSRNRTMALLGQLVNYECKTTSIIEMASALDKLRTKIISLSPRSALPEEWMILKLMKLAGPSYDTDKEIIMGQEGLTWSDAVARLREKEIALLLTAQPL